MIKAVVLDLDVVIERSRSGGNLNAACVGIDNGAERRIFHQRNLNFDSLSTENRQILKPFIDTINQANSTPHYTALFEMLRTLEQRRIPVYYYSSTLFPGAAELLLEAIHTKANITPFRKQTLKNVRDAGIQSGGLLTFRDSLSEDMPRGPHDTPRDGYQLLSRVGHVEIDKRDLLLVSRQQDIC